MGSLEAHVLLRLSSIYLSILLALYLILLCSEMQFPFLYKMIKDALHISHLLKNFRSRKSNVSLHENIYFQYKSIISMKEFGNSKKERGMFTYFAYL